MGRSLREWKNSSHLYGSNAPFIEAYYESWLDDEHSVPAGWAEAFEAMRDGAAAETGHLQVQERFRLLGRMPAMAVADSTAADHREAGVLNLINAYRVRGHENARINPLGLAHHDPVPDLDLGFHDLTEADLDREFDTGSLAAPRRMMLRDIESLLNDTYCGSIGVEYMHIIDTDKRRWLQERLEGAGADYGLTAEQKTGILRKLTAAEGLEKYLHTRYVGQKRFSLEGGESLIPLLHQAIRHAGTQDIREVVVGMAHRGRLNVLVNILGKSPVELFHEFEGKHANGDPARSGDVKYHMGYSSDTATRGGLVHVALAFNPSHLEIVDPVVVGSARARQVRRRDHAHDQVMPVLIHGDAAFAGQGVIMELFQMSETRGFAVGGALHIVVNNQIGFTTSRREDARSTLYCTPIAKMVHAPIFHVNADDPEAVHHVVKIACDFRKEFKRDVVIDLVCYRRHGHNEADEPSATQPLMYRTIRDLKSTRQIYAEKLAAEGVIDAARARKMVDNYRDRLDRGEQVADVEESPPKNESSVDWTPFIGHEWNESVDTAVPAERIAELSNRLTTLPEGFEVHPRVERIIADREQMAAGKLRLDWGFAETAAYATLITEGFGLRLVGQDSGRGTFFHRHAVLHNQADGETHLALAGLNDEVDVTVIDSLLSEEAVLGFEYGYASSEPNSLVIWEAQFGDFVNSAQVVIDQFIASGETKWGRLSGLVLFLPHGYEGQGPEHSSARLERFMQLCSHNNMQVCVPTTPAQMFHMLRRQMLRDYRKPLIVMTPKSLLRSSASSSTLEDLSGGRFRLVIDDPAESDRKNIRRVIFCAGKVYYDLADAREAAEIGDVALVRIEQLYPFPADRVVEVLAGYPDATEVAWCQEEPLNQGAWYQIKHHIEACIGPRHDLFYAGREGSSSPAVGYYSVHIEQQQDLVRDALEPGGGVRTVIGEKG